MTDEIILHINFAELSGAVQMPEEVLLEVIGHGILQPVDGNAKDNWLFENAMVNVLKKAVRLHQDLEINWQGIAMVLELLEQREQLLAENAMLKQRLNRFVDHLEG